jgi:hypothetical protein
LNFTSEGDVKTATELDSLAELLSKQPHRGATPSSPQHVEIQSKSGALYVRGESKPPRAATLSEQDVIPAAQQIVGSLGLAEASVAETESYQNMLAKRSVRDTKAKVETRPKSSVVTFRRQVEVDGQQVPVLGNGGFIKVALNNDGSLRTLVKVWRTVAGTARRAKLKTMAQAQAEALRMVPNPHEYRVANIRWGYKELAGNVAQDEMRVIYEVQLVPNNSERELDAPPAVFEIAAQD